MAPSEQHAPSSVGRARALLGQGLAIPAHPLALDARRRLDERRQRALTRYYIDAGAGGLAVGVHTTQFTIREAGLYEPVLRLAAETASAWAPQRELALVAGLAGGTEQALREAEIARQLGYHAGLLSLAALPQVDTEALIAHCRAVSQVLPLIGFYLQPAVGGRVLDEAFWTRFAEIDNVVAIKIAPFNRYRTLDVVRGVVNAEAESRVSLYTGNDDHIVLDLLTPHQVMRAGRPVTVRCVGGLLGHWSGWTKSAVETFERCRALARSGASIDAAMLALDARVTDCNAALFDVANDFHGCIAGCHEVLRRQGLLDGIWCLDPAEGLGRGQADRIDRIVRDHADLTDDAFVAANLARWLT